MKIRNSAQALAGSACHNSPELAFRDAMQNAFGQLAWLPEADGAIHRFRVPGDQVGSRNGWYVLFPDGIAAGAFGSWRSGGSSVWTSRKPANRLEERALRKRIQHAKAQREADHASRNFAAAKYAEKLWSHAQPADPAHAYLTSKRVPATHLRQCGDALLVPLYASDHLCNLQRVYPDGAKRFLSGGRVKGAYSPIGIPAPGLTLYICEGWATGLTIHEETGAAVACAMNAGNLLAVGRQLQHHYPDTPLIIAGDDDRKTEGNPGRVAATQAAETLRCGLVLPSFPSDAPVTLSDFNDLANWRTAQ